MKNVIRDKNGCFRRTRNIWTPTNWDDAHVGPKGRMMVYRPDCPRATKEGYALRSQVVWWLHHGSAHPKNRDLHHKDENKQNDKIENLESLSKSQHQKEHRENWVFLNCKNCGTPFREHVWRITQREKEGSGIPKFCSQKCYHSFPRTSEHGNAISIGLIRAWKDVKRS